MYHRTESWQQRAHNVGLDGRTGQVLREQSQRRNGAFPSAHQNIRLDVNVNLTILGFFHNTAPR